MYVLNYLEPAYRVPSHTHISTVCCRIYNLQREKVKNEIEGSSLALTTDIWTSTAVESYLTVTTHFVDEFWHLCSRVLITKEMPERHTGSNIVQRLKQPAEEWGIQPRQVSAIIHDNAANAVLGAELTEWPHFGCVAHTLQLCVTSGLELPVIDRMVAVARKLAGHFRHSVVATTALRKKQTRLEIPIHSLIQDVTTRWNSFFFNNILCIKQRIHKIATKANTSAYP